MIRLNFALIVGLAGGLSALFMAGLSLVMSRAPGWRELRSFSLLAVCAAGYCFTGLVHVLEMSPSSVVVGDRLQLAVTFAYALTLVRHLAVADHRPLRRIERWIIGIGIGFTVLALIPGVAIVPPVRKLRVEWLDLTYSMSSATWVGLVGITFLVGSMLFAAFCGGRRWRDGWHARLPMIAPLLLATAGVSDTLSSLGIIPMPQLVEGLTAVVVGTMGISYVQRFLADARRLEALSTRLEQEVARRTEELLQAQARAAEHERLAGLGRVAAGVAHEINNPTAVVQQNLDRLRAVLSEREPLSAEIDERLLRSRAATQRIADIVRQLLDSARDPSTDRARPTEFALAEVVDRAVSAAATTAPDLRVSSAVDVALTARGQPPLLEQVLINLLVNAAHAGSGAPGGPRARIEAIRDDDVVRITVTDNGPGIDASIRDRLFEPFATTKPIGQGTGLGLAVSRGLMTRQGGALLVARSDEGGTAMAIELPAAEPLAAASRDLRVLVIDDNDDLREVLVLQLETFFVVEEAGSVAHAVSRLAEGRRYDAVLCDLMMPAGGAASWLTACASHDPELAERTLLVTGGATTPQAAALVAARGDLVLHKPVEVAVLRQAITRLTRRPSAPR